MAIVKAKVRNKTNRGQLGIPPKRTANVRVLEDQLRRMVSRGAVEVLGDTQPVDGTEDGPKVEVLDQPEGKTPEKIRAAKQRAEGEAAAVEQQRGRSGRG